MLPADFADSPLITEATDLYHQRPGAVIIPPEAQGSQRDWDRPLIEQQHRDLIDAMDDQTTTARLNGVATKQSGRWLQALPSPQLGLHLDDDSLRVAVALRLGAPICQPHNCACGAPVGELGRHGLSCRRSAGRHPRHHALNETIRRALVSAGIPAVLEPVGTSRSDLKRPDGATMVPWQHGKPLLWDATCVDTLAATNLAFSANEVGGPARRAEERKVVKYQHLLDRFIFVPLGFETLGSFGPQCLEFVREVGARITEQTHEQRATLFLQQRLSIDIQRGNAAAVLGTLPPSKSLDEIYYLL
jgi:hypothetical protein